VDVRVISATNRDLAEEVRKGSFREDLYYRLAVYRINLPPLRERTGDIPLLAREFVKRFSAEEGKTIGDVSPHAMARLESHSFPGNIRELENIVRHAVVNCNRDRLMPEDLPGDLRAADLQEDFLGNGAIGASGPPAAPTAADDIVPLETLEAQAIRQAISLCGENLVEASRRLGISRATMYRKVLKLGISRQGAGGGLPRKDASQEPPGGATPGQPEDPGNGRS
jgi:DNA-binding NtrC family response regulator